MVTPHVLKRIKERQIEIDIEMVEYFCQNIIKILPSFLVKLVSLEKRIMLF